MQAQQNGNGQRGTQGRPTVRAERGEPLIRQLFEERRTEIEGMFARDDNPKASYDRAVGLALSTYKVAQAGSGDMPIQEASVVMAALYAFQRKLDPGTDVYFVPFKGKVTAITSPTGLINVAYRSGLIGAIDARPVFKGEVTAGNFDHELGSTRWVKHRKGACARPMGADANWRELAFAYAIVDIKGATQPVIEVLDRGDIEYYRSLSPSANSSQGLWGKFPAEAARKAALKQALGRVPKQSEVSEILAYEAAAESEADAAVSRIAEVADLTVIPAEEAPEAPRAQAPQARPTPQAQARPPASPAARPGPDPFAGNPDEVDMPGKAPQPKISAGDAAKIAQWEGRMRTDLDNGVMDTPEKARFKAGNVRQLATLRLEMRRREMAVEPHAYLDGTPAPAAREPDPSTGELSREEEEALFATSGGSDTAGYAS